MIYSNRGDTSQAGASARHQADRAREQRRQYVSGRSGVGRVVRLLVGPSATEKQLVARESRWATGARGEEMLAETLARRCPDVLALHDRRIPRSPANIDHIAIAASGVYVIDTKRYRGKIEVARPLLGQAKLKIAGRDQTKLISGLERQVAVVRDVLAGVAHDVPVHGCLCFVAPEGFMADSGLPLLRTLRIRGYPLYSPRRLARRLNSQGEVTAQRADAICDVLAGHLRPAR
jgi:hypothetical protein